MTSVSNWGNYPVVEAKIEEFENAKDAGKHILNFNNCVVRGTGLSYGDASLSPKILSTARFNRIISFDDDNGIIVTEAGVTLDQVLLAIVPKGWFLPVTPGTKFITVGVQ
jgi:decaprenylphospho-beta-D-ribofuranose 2-oxidase